ncbi:hypothetical protein HMPREF9436_01594 [Faecalibacterium cf. prausnitzii KLE1255]|uniref:Uncharacterized protein n=1 Tax=Faecalibacterium cf. prausnitzii KLE1255 TaxID=748224 RepID=E2ZIV0_9FIRM|nr:hypothetical protein HMPREF9436_01594 [Faecalibacterium cf. prausnitzii KLE1255]
MNGCFPLRNTKSRALCAFFPLWSEEFRAELLLFCFVLFDFCAIWKFYSVLSP